MLPNPYEAERLAEEYRKDRLREAQQARLVREAEAFAPKAVSGWAWMVLLCLLAAAALIGLTG